MGYKLVANYNTTATINANGGINKRRLPVYSFGGMDGLKPAHLVSLLT